MNFNLATFCKENQNVCLLVLLLVVLYFTGYLHQLLAMLGLEGFEVVASEKLGTNEVNQAVTGLGRTPASCYPQQKLTPNDLLPTDESAAIKEFNIAKPVGEGILQGVNMLDATYHVGVNTIGQSLRNANLQLRSEPPNPQVNVSPWLNTTIGPDLARRPLEAGEDCYASVNSM